MSNQNINYNEIWAIVLAAGKGKRMKAKNRNKVAYEVFGKPMILRTIETLKETGINNILIVVGYAKESVINLLDKGIKTVEQKKRLGTGHAVKVALKKIPVSARYILVVYGDDSFLYSSKIFNKLITTHINTSSELTFLTIEMQNPSGLGRVVRDKKGNVIGVIEEKDATPEQKKINEINTACYIFSNDFLKKYINKIPKSKITGEYYLPILTQIAIQNSKKIEALKIDDAVWRGVNTLEELKEAEQYFKKT